MQYEKVPRKIPSVHCVTRSLEKLTMMRGENCIDARVSVISRMANTMDTTVIMEAAMPARMTWATCGSACEGNRAVGTQALAAGNSSSKQDRTAPAQPSASAIVRGRIKKPPRRLYTVWRKINGRLLLTISSSVADQTRAHKEEQRVPPSCSIQRTGFAKGIETLQPYKRPCQPISVIAERAERTAVIVTTNLPFSEWTQVIPNARLCKALLDRITDRAHILETGKESYRFRRSMEKQKKGGKASEANP